jgi:hypothetical protein
LPVRLLPCLGQTLAQLHLLHEKSRIHGRVRVLTGIDSLQTEQVTRARDGILEGLKGGVDLCRQLQREAPFRFGGRRIAIRVKAPLQFTIACGEIDGIDIEGDW